MSSFVKLNFSFADTVFSINCAAKTVKKTNSFIDWNNRSLQIASKLYPNVLIILASIFYKTQNEGTTTVQNIGVKIVARKGIKYIESFTLIVPFGPVENTFASTIVE